MNTAARYALVVVLLFFSWKGVSLDLKWPLEGASSELSVKPDGKSLEWAAQVRPIAAKMLPSDRLYLANLYDAMKFILERDFVRDDPIVSTTDDFVNFHTSSLRLAIEKKNVGKYPGLAEAIDRTFLNALGPDQQKLDKNLQQNLSAACGALSYVFEIGRDE